LRRRPKRINSQIHALAKRNHFAAFAQIKLLENSNAGQADQAGGQIAEHASGRVRAEEDP
jgi:hypothetical protein